VLQRFATDAAVRGLNHLLERETRVRESLLPLAGRVARLEAGRLSLQFAICADGSVRASEARPNVTIGIDPAAVARNLGDPDALLREARIAGDADMAQVLSNLAARIRPDFEEDLSRLVGDAAAVRVMATLRSAAEQAADSGQRLARNVADYLAGERALLASRVSLERFSSEVDALAQAVERLAVRVDALR
jgi:ubiquinone biosynthesis accessory factor UbiJ